MNPGQYFAYEYHGAPFILFGPAHIVTLIAILLLNLGLLFFRNKSEKVLRIVRWTLAILLWTNEAAWHIWNLYWGHWDVNQLPLHICSILIWLTGFMLITKNYRIYEFVYFMGIGGALQAILTPDVGIWGFPHFRYFQTFISHGLLITSAVYMTIVEGYRPTWKSMLRVLVGMNLYMAIIYPINAWLGTNFLYINRKPATASLLDVLPAWPYYLLYMEAIGVVMCLILYLPFIIKDISARRKSPVREPL